MTLILLGSLSFFHIIFLQTFYDEQNGQNRENDAENGEDDNPGNAHFVGVVGDGLVFVEGDVAVLGIDCGDVGGGGYVVEFLDVGDYEGAEIARIFFHHALQFSIQVNRRRQYFPSIHAVKLSLTKLSRKTTCLINRNSWRIRSRNRQIEGTSILLSLLYRSLPTLDQSRLFVVIIVA